MFDRGCLPIGGPSEPPLFEFYDLFPRRLLHIAPSPIGPVLEAHLTTELDTILPVSCIAQDDEPVCLAQPLHHGGRYHLGSGRRAYTTLVILLTFCCDVVEYVY